MNEKKKRENMTQNVAKIIENYSNCVMNSVTVTRRLNSLKQYLKS